MKDECSLGFRDILGMHFPELPGDAVELASLLELEAAAVAPLQLPRPEQAVLEAARLLALPRPSPDPASGRPRPCCRPSA